MPARAHPSRFAVPPPARSWPAAALAGPCLAGALVLAGAAPAAGRQDPPPPPVGVDAPPAAVEYQPPVAAPVVAPFDAPAGPYGPGNRGLEYGAGAGEQVRAAAAGTVTFAGQVAGELHVTVLHADRVRTTYGRLRTITVSEGTPVAAGTVVGTATPRFIWTARLGTAYLDPAVLLAASGHAAVRLVGTDGTALDPTPPGAGRGPGPAPVPPGAADWALEPAPG